MIINKEKALEMAKEQSGIFVGTLTECHEFIENFEGYPKNEICIHKNIERLDGTKFDGNKWQAIKNNKILTDENNNYWYYVYLVNGLPWQIIK